MSLLLTIISFLVIFSILVLIHEWGHFFAARKAGIKVEEFGFGMPPRIWGFKKGETLYSVNWIPFGGFVRLLGEDNGGAALKNKRSFASKPARVRTMVIVAGVLMNFILSWFLLTIGFMFGIQPLLITGDDLLKSIDNGTVTIESGIIIKEVKEGGVAAQAGIKAGDRITKINGHEVVSSDQLGQSLKVNGQNQIALDVVQNGQLRTFQLALEEGKPLDLTPYEVLFLPRVVVADVKPESAASLAGIQPGDVVLKMNDHAIYYMEEYRAYLEGQGELQMMLLRGNDIVNLVYSPPRKDLVVVSAIYPDTPAEKAGVMNGDIIVTMNGQAVSGPEDVVNITKQSPGQDVQYELRRGSELKNLAIAPSESGLIGVGLSVLRPYENEEVSVYGTQLPFSATKIEDVRYPVWEAPFVALDESGKLAIVTADMFVNVLRSVFTQFTVPEGVAGPVGIAQMTTVFVQQGFLSVLRFMALLSLSLAIINILPVPGLDGGRLLFIIIEVVAGKRVHGRFEAIIHAIGFVLLMLLILAVTYKDILRLL